MSCSSVEGLNPSFQRLSRNPKWFITNQAARSKDLLLRSPPIKIGVLATDNQKKERLFPADVIGVVCRALINRKPAAHRISTCARVAGALSKI